MLITAECISILVLQGHMRHEHQKRRTAMDFVVSLNPSRSARELQRRFSLIIKWRVTYGRILLAWSLSGAMCMLSEIKQKSTQSFQIGDM